MLTGVATEETDQWKSGSMTRLFFFLQQAQARLQFSGSEASVADGWFVHKEQVSHCLPLSVPTQSPHHNQDKGFLSQMKIASDFRIEIFMIHQLDLIDL